MRWVELFQLWERIVQQYGCPPLKKKCIHRRRGENFSQNYGFQMIVKISGNLAQGMGYINLVERLSRDGVVPFDCWILNFKLKRCHCLSSHIISYHIYISHTISYHISYHIISYHHISYLTYHIMSSYHISQKNWILVLVGKNILSWPKTEHMTFCPSCCAHSCIPCWEIYVIG